MDKASECKCCGVLKTKNGTALCPYCKVPLANMVNYPPCRKCPECSNTFPLCKCKGEGGCDGCSEC